MQVRFGNFNISSLARSYNNVKASNTIAFCGFKEDVFEKTKEVKSVDKQISNKDRIKELYDETYEIVKKQNPLINKLKIQKPKLLFNHSQNEALANYSFSYNAIEVNEKYIDRDWYLLCLTCDDDTKVPLGVLPDIKVHQEMAGLNKMDNFKGIEAVKLNEDEKEMWYKGILAHEIRHFVQENLLASDINCSREFLIDKKVLFANYIFALQDVIKGKEEKNETDSVEYRAWASELDSAKSIAPSIFDFKPKRMVTRDRILPFSMFHDGDYRLWSTKGHIMRASNEYSNDENAYLSSPLELDAMHYQDEFLADLYEKNRGKCRYEIAYGMLQGLRANYQHGLRNLMNNGYEPLV